MRVLTLLVIVPMGVALASSNCNTKVFKALKSVENNPRVCEYLHDHKEKWSETNDKSYLPSGLKKFQVQDVYEACDCLNVEEEEAPIEAPIEAPKGNKGGKYVNEEPEFESEPVKPAKPVKIVKTKTVQVPTTIIEREIATETETEIITVERTVFQPRTATAIQTSTETVISCTATKTEALDTITTTIAATTVTETTTETLKPEFNLHACIPEPSKEAEPAWEAAPVRESKREPIDERESEKYDDDEEYDEPKGLRPVPPIGGQSDEIKDMWSRWAKGPAPELPESPYELGNPNCAPKGSRCWVKESHCCGGACSAFNSGGLVGVCAQEPVIEYLHDDNAPRQPNQWFEGAKKWGY